MPKFFRAPLSTKSETIIPITRSGYAEPVKATSIPAQITPKLTMISLDKKDPTSLHVCTIIFFDETLGIYNKNWQLALKQQFQSSRKTLAHYHK